MNFDYHHPICPVSCQSDHKSMHAPRMDVTIIFTFIVFYAIYKVIQTMNLNFESPFLHFQSLPAQIGPLYSILSPLVMSVLRSSTDDLFKWILLDWYIVGLQWSHQLWIEFPMTSTYKHFFLPFAISLWPYKTNHVKKCSPPTPPYTSEGFILQTHYKILLITSFWLSCNAVIPLLSSLWLRLPNVPPFTGLQL